MDYHLCLHRWSEEYFHMGKLTGPLGCLRCFLRSFWPTTGSRRLLWFHEIMTEHPTTSWQAMQDGNVFYRRQQLYSVPGKMPDLSDYIVAGCRYGGPIGRLLPSRVFEMIFTPVNLALMRDNTKLLAVGRSTPASTKAQIQIYSPAGESLLLFSVDDCVLLMRVSNWLMRTQ